MRYFRNYLFLLYFFVTPIVAQTLAPDVLARSVTEDVLAIIKADKEIQLGNQKKMLELVDAKVLPHFSFASMTQLAMGRNWRQANVEQQQQLIAEFRTLLVRTYTAALTQYKNQTVQYKPVRMAPGDTDVVVQSLVKPVSGAPVAVDLNMEKTDIGWKVYNVKIEGISLVENYRNTFNSEIQKNGVDGLIKSLAEKNRSNAQVTQK
ncbi:MAG TPA: ABC transporter substrate-binding protein [Burkholderiales bacterium]|nr:ABC transporter substrate-binding protein [Burkholderiales bacterium]